MIVFIGVTPLVSVGSMVMIAFIAVTLLVSVGSNDCLHWCDTVGCVPRVHPT